MGVFSAPPRAIARYKYTSWWLCTFFLLKNVTEITISSSGSCSLSAPAGAPSDIGYICTPKTEMENTRDKTDTMHTQLLHHTLHWDLAINQDYIFPNVLQLLMHVCTTTSKLSLQAILANNHTTAHPAEAVSSCNTHCLPLVQLLLSATHNVGCITREVFTHSMNTTG